MVGTSGALRLVAPRPVLHPAGRSWCYAIDAAHWLVGGAINNGGVALSWLRELFNRASGEQVSFDDLAALAAQAPAGAGGLLCLPFFAGERSPNWNLNARGVFFGLSLQHGAAHMARALLEGVAFRFSSLAEMLAEAGCAIGEVRASGGFVHSPLWLQITASALQRELRLPSSGETSSWGAAAWALIGAGALGSLEEAGAQVEVKSGVRYQKKDYDGLPLLFGMRSYGQADTVRITWPDGMIQNEPNQPVGKPLAYREAPRLSGSCPMVFTWNGKQFKFLMDVLGRVGRGDEGRRQRQWQGLAPAE